MPVVRSIGSLDGFSRTLWNSLLALGLIDRPHLMISPAAIEEGTPLFSGACTLGLRDPRRFDGSDNVLLRSAVRS